MQATGLEPLLSRWNLRGISLQGRNAPDSACRCSVGMVVFFDYMNQNAQCKAGRGRRHPTQIQVEPWQHPSRKPDGAIEMEAALQTCGQRFQEIEQGGNAGKCRNAHIYGSVMCKQFPKKRQQDQCDGKRIQEHQNRQRILDDFG